MREEKKLRKAIFKEKEIRIRYAFHPFKFSYMFEQTGKIIGEKHSSQKDILLFILDSIRNFKKM